MILFSFCLKNIFSIVFSVHLLSQNVFILPLFLQYIFDSRFPVIASIIIQFILKSCMWPVLISQTITLKWLEVCHKPLQIHRLKNVATECSLWSSSYCNHPEKWVVPIMKNVQQACWSTNRSYREGLWNSHSVFSFSDSTAWVWARLDELQDSFYPIKGPEIRLQMLLLHAQDWKDTYLRNNNL